MLQVSNVDLKGGQSSRRFALPPVHLFWGASEQNQRTYYYHLLVLRREFLLHAQGDYLGLFTEEWRSILGNTYWKSMWPRPKPDDVNSSNFNTARFWIYGGPLFFGDELSAKVTCGHDPTSLLPCRCGVELDTADDVEVRQTVLYHLNMDQMSAEIKEMDRLQFPMDFKKRWDQGRLSAILHMTDMWGDAGNGGVNSGFFEDKKAWRSWLWAVCEVVMEWEGFDDWEGFKGFRYMGINQFNKLPQKEFYTLTVHLLVFFITTFVTRLGYYPSPMLHPPILTGHHCAKHRRKFGFFAAGHV